jgi:hypothetical protein
MSRLKLSVIFSSLLLMFSFVPVSNADAAVLFEGWSKVLISGQHVGYIIQRYEFDEKKKEYRATHFMKIAGSAAEGGGLTDSLVARADSSFKPISYQYTGLKEGKPILIDATFKGDKMTAAVTEGKEKKTITNTVPKGAFLSAFLGYVMLQGKEGLKKGVKYEYQSVLEESASIAKGEAFIADEETVSGIPAFRILNTVNGARFISLATHKAEVLGTVSPNQGVQTSLVGTMEEAVAGHGVNSAALTQLFGTMPKGKENELAKRNLLPAVPATPATSPAAAPAAAPAVPSATSAPPAAPQKEN